MGSRQNQGFQEESDGLWNVRAVFWRTDWSAAASRNFDGLGLKNTAVPVIRIIVLVAHIPPPKKICACGSPLAAAATTSPISPFNLIQSNRIFLSYSLIMIHMWDPAQLGRLGPRTGMMAAAAFVAEEALRLEMKIAWHARAIPMSARQCRWLFPAESWRWHAKIDSEHHQSLFERILTEISKYLRKTT